MGTLILQDGTVVSGESFGAIGGYEGEVVFNTSMYTPVLGISGFVGSALFLFSSSSATFSFN